jgi:hypothetical protein
LNPIQAHYQAVLRPDVGELFAAGYGLPNYFEQRAGLLGFPSGEESIDQLRQFIAVTALENRACRNA